MTIPCNQEPTIERIDKKLDIIDSKIDSFIQRTTVLETTMGFIKTGFLVFITPIIIMVIKHYYFK